MLDALARSRVGGVHYHQTHYHGRGHRVRNQNNRGSPNYPARGLPTNFHESHYATSAAAAWSKNHVTRLPCREINCAG